MAAFFSTSVTVANTTAIKVVDSEEFDRRVSVNDSTGSIMRVAFTSADASTGMKVVYVNSVPSQATATFNLPADHELWVWQDSGGSATAGVLVTVK